MPLGLKEEQEVKVKQVLRKHPEIEKVLLFGSRAKNTHQPGSDIDLALFGDQITHKDLLQLKKDLNELNLPYKFDPVIYSRISEPALKEHIHRVGVLLFTKKEKI